MLKPQKLNKGDKVAIVSLSRGLLGMPFCKHELDIAIKRLEEFGLIPVIMPNALKDMDYLQNHPEARASPGRLLSLRLEDQPIIWTKRANRGSAAMDSRVETTTAPAASCSS